MPAPMGLLNLDKPAGPTSHDVVQQVRRAAGTRRVGHAGTLDPLATGVLLVFVGRATRLIEYVVSLPKTYEATVRLGQETSTYDAEGDVVSEHPVDISQAALEEALAAFRGPIRQLPPMFSAVKRQGQPLYRLARQGVTVEREPRSVTVYELALLDVTWPCVSLRISCSAGTYIRTLAHDLGNRLGCGGHISALRRTQIGSFHVADATPLTALGERPLSDVLLPADRAVEQFPAIVVTADEGTDLRLGRRIALLDGAPGDALARAYDQDGQFLGVVAAQGDQWQPRKILAIDG